jgi:hypothetical protein
VLSVNTHNTELRMTSKRHRSFIHVRALPARNSFPIDLLA